MLQMKSAFGGKLRSSLHADADNWELWDKVEMADESQKPQAPALNQDFWGARRWSLADSNPWKPEDISKL